MGGGRGGKAGGVKRGGRGGGVMGGGIYVNEYITEGKGNSGWLYLSQESAQPCQ